MSRAPTGEATGGRRRVLTSPPAVRRTGLRHSVTTSLVGKATELVTLVLLATVVPRVLGPERFGRFALPLTIVTLGSLALTLGGPTLMARYVPAAPAGERVALARALCVRLAQGRAGQLAVIAAATAAAAVAVPERVSPLDAALVVTALILNVAATLALQTTLGLGGTALWSFRYPVQNTVLIATVLVLEPALGHRGGLVAILLAGLVAAGIGAAAVRPVLGPGHPEVAIPAGAIRFGALHAAGAALVQATHRGVVVAVAVLAAGSVETGYAALAVGIALSVTHAVLQAFTVSLPHLAAGRASGTRVGASPAEATLRRLAGALLALLVPATVTIAALLDRLVPTALGPGYQGAEAALVPALAVVVLAPLGALVVQAAALRLRPEVPLASGMACVLTFLVLASLLVPVWGAAGGTAATLAGTAAGALLGIRRLPGAAGWRVTTASFVGTAAVLGAAPGWWGAAG
ncbi:MAG: hypothetical protein ACLFXM_02435 [Acidimicrobiia bacterium]